MDTASGIKVCATACQQRMRPVIIALQVQQQPQHLLSMVAWKRGGLSVWQLKTQCSLCSSCSFVRIQQAACGAPAYRGRGGEGSSAPTAQSGAAPPARHNPTDVAVCSGHVQNQVTAPAEVRQPGVTVTAAVSYTQQRRAARSVHQGSAPRSVRPEPAARSVHQGSAPRSVQHGACTERAAWTCTTSVHRGACTKSVQPAAKSVQHEACTKSVQQEACTRERAAGGNGESREQSRRTDKPSWDRRSTWLRPSNGTVGATAAAARSLKVARTVGA